MSIARVGSQEGTQQPALESSSAVSLRDRLLKVNICILKKIYISYFKVLKQSRFFKTLLQIKLEVLSDTYHQPFTCFPQV